MISSYKLQEPVYTGQTLSVPQRPERDRERQQVRASPSLVALQTFQTCCVKNSAPLGTTASLSTLPRPETARVHGCGCWSLSTCVGCSRALTGQLFVLRFVPFHHFICLGAERSWVKIWKALTGNRARVEILVANLRFSARTKRVPHHSLPQVSTDQTLLRHSALQ